MFGLVNGVFFLTQQEGRSAGKERETAWAEEVLIGKADLEEKNTMMAELKTRVRPLSLGTQN